MHYFERWDAHNKAREKARKVGVLQRVLLCVGEGGGGVKGT